MLDLLFNPLKAERHPFEIFVIAVFYSSLSILLGLWIFDGTNYLSMSIVFFVTISCLYVVQGAIKMEEKKERNYQSEWWLLGQHRPLIILILVLFVGFVLSFTLWTLFLPQDISLRVFEAQSLEVQQISLVTGNALNTSGALGTIFSHNLNLVFISLVFAFFMGAGAIYILVWNASVMGFVIGEVSRQTIGLAALPIAFTKYFIHGIPEMLAYIVAAVAGGILYFALIRGDLTKGDRLKRILIDVLALVAVSVILLVVAALLEVYVSTLV